MSNCAAQFEIIKLSLYEPSELCMLVMVSSPSHPPTFPLRLLERAATIERIVTCFHDVRLWRRILRARAQSLTKPADWLERFVNTRPLLDWKPLTITLQYSTNTPWYIHLGIDIVQRNSPLPLKFMIWIVYEYKKCSRWIDIVSLVHGSLIPSLFTDMVTFRDYSALGIHLVLYEAFSAIVFGFNVSPSWFYCSSSFLSFTMQENG